MGTPIRLVLLLQLAWLLALGQAVPFPDKPAPPLPPGCHLTTVGCFSDGCLEAGKCPKDVLRALGGDTAVHRFDKGCLPPGPTSPPLCPGVGLTAMECFELCAFNSFSYAGLEAGRCCYCANSIESGPQTKLSDADSCSTKCTGNSSETCGGAYRVEIYSLGCGAGWAVWFLLTCCIVAVAYFGGGTVYMNHSQGLQGADAIPQIHFWRNVHGLVLDGVEKQKWSARSRSCPR